MPKTKQYDLVVIGGGSAGLTAVTIAARLGARSLLVDRESLGGDCLHYGCVPSKSLIASARMAYRMRHAEKFGFDSVDLKADLARVMNRVDKIRDEIGSHESPDAIRKLGVDVALGGASFVDEFTIEIDRSYSVAGDRFLIATGSHAVAPDIPGLVETGFIDHVDLFGLQKLPDRLVVIGGGPIGAEMGQALSRLGSKVTIIQRGSRLLPREDSDISVVLQNSFAEEGIGLMLSANPVRVSQRDRDKEVEIQQHGKTHAIRCDEILVAVGRKPNIDALNLSAAGIRENSKGIVVDDSLRTSKPRIFAVGDCNGGPQFTHWAEYEARIATRNALYRGSSKRSMRTLPWVTFTDPEVARVGMTLDEAGSAGNHSQIHEHRFPYSQVDRAICESDTAGMIKVIVDKSERVLGAHIIGPGAGEALTEWVLAIENRLSLRRIGKAIHVYPTLGRINRRVADEAFMAHGVSEWTNKLFARFRPIARAQNRRIDERLRD
jgi:pyruvate/2-oxoglutarate dehydrogenase complex dihydrolipoamide dehydrogenase (E3) component